MKANEFKSIIKRLIKEEIEQEVERQVSKQLPKLLFEMLDANSKQKTIVKENNQYNSDSSTIPRKTQLRPVVESKSPPKTVKKYVKDPILNAILNETTPDFPQSEMNTGVPLPNFEKIGVSQEFVGEIKEILNESTDSMLPPTGELIQENTPTTGPDLTKLFNKDFKAILNKSKKGHGGNFSRALQNW